MAVAREEDRGERLLQFHSRMEGEIRGDDDDDDDGALSTNIISLLIQEEPKRIVEEGIE